MNGYARVSHVAGDIAGTGGQTSLIPVYLRAIEEVSREFDREARRPFYTTEATRYFGAAGECATGSCPCNEDPFWHELRGRSRDSRLFLGFDLLAVSSLTADQDGDGTYETTLVADTDYWLWPANETPYRALELNRRGQLASWPSGRRRVKVTGTWGYSNETEDTLQTVADNPLLIGATTLTVQSTADIDPGETLVIEDEQIYVVSVNDPTTLTVARGINSTTAAQHAQSTVVYRRRYPRDIEECVKARVVGRRWDAQSGYTGSVELLGDPMAGRQSQGRATYAQFRRVAGNYADPGAVI